MPNESAEKKNKLIVGLFIVDFGGAVYASLAATRQTDIKCTVACQVGKNRFKSCLG